MDAKSFVFVGILGMTGLALTGCSMIVAVQEPSRLFHPYISGVGPTFQVIDRRPMEKRNSRQVDASWYYGDEQFSPTVVKVVADRFARTFPKAREGTALIITELELRYDLAKVGHIQPGCVVIADCFLVIPLARAYNGSRNVVSVRLGGAFDGVTFSDGYDAEFEDHALDGQERRVLSALQSAIDKALTDVHERLEARAHAHTN